MNSGVIHVPKIADGKQPKPIKWIEVEGGCHISTSHSANDKGYPLVRRRMKPVKLMRFIYELHHGESPKGVVIRHSCDNPACINIAHLSIGSIADNNKDRHSRGRDFRPLGMINGNRVLNEDQVVEILKNPDKTVSYFSKKFSVYISTISSIRKRKTWKHIELA